MLTLAMPWQRRILKYNGRYCLLGERYFSDILGENYHFCTLEVFDFKLVKIVHIAEILVDVLS